MRKIKVVVLLVQQLQHGFTKNAKVSPNLTVAHVSLATQTAAICVRFHGRRVRHMYVTMQITFLTRKSALIYTSLSH